MSTSLVVFFHTRCENGLFFSAVVTGCGDGVVRCFDAKSGHLLRTYSGHPGAVLAIHMSRDKIYTTTTDGNVRVFHIDWKFVK